MTKGTSSSGKHNKKTHMICRRCGRHSYHVKDKECSACGFGKSTKLKWNKSQWKDIQRTGRVK